MRKIIKKMGKKVKAYRLGNTHPIIVELEKLGQVRRMTDGTYEIFSKEAINGSGEVAYVGDYIKFSSTGEPYPNQADFFEKNHRHIQGDEYEQVPKMLEAWMAQDDMCPEVEFLIREKGLKLQESTPEKYFEAPLWGTILSAAKDAVLVFYKIDRDEEGKIHDADFNFVEREEFEKTYIEM